MDDKTGTRVCIIGAGPSGLLTLRRFLQLGAESPEVVCYEKQSTWGGQWNFTWKTGTDESGEIVHSSLYRNLVSNNPKECLQLPEYTFDDHFGRPIPSHISVPVMKSYLQGLMKRSPRNLEDHIQYNTVVKGVKYDTQRDRFLVQTTHLPTRKSETQTFSHVIVANGIFSTPFLPPDIQGIETFPGLIIHSHDVKQFEMFRKKRVLIIGSMYSAEDIAINSIKYGSDSVIIGYRRAPRNLHWPEGIEERPMVTNITNDVATFKDGTTATIDIIIICTGYIYHFPFLEDNLRLEELQTSLFPKHLHKGVIWLKGGNQKLLYVGMQMTIHSLPMFDIQAIWIVRYITGINPLNNQRMPGPLSVINESTEEVEEYLEMKQVKLKTVTCENEAVDFMTEYYQPMADEVGYKVDFVQYDNILKTTFIRKADNIMTYRDGQYTCDRTNVTSPKPKTPWRQRFEDGVEGCPQ